MAAVLFLGAVFGTLSLGYCGNYTVTDEAWFTVHAKSLNGRPYTGTFVIGVFGETCPMTALNFVSIAHGYKRVDEEMAYKGTLVHRVVQDLVVQMGDITTGDGTGGKSIYGRHFADENFILSHRSPGWVSMANHGPDTNNSQFFILLNKARWLDGKHVVFGKVVRGWDVIQTLGNIATDLETASPRTIIKVIDCGLNLLKQRYDLGPDQLDSTDDIGRN